MNKITEQIKNAFEQGKSLKVGNTRTDGKTVWLHGSPIVKRDFDGLVRASLAGYNTQVTRERVNGITGLCFRQKKGKAVLNNQEIDPSDWFAVAWHKNPEIVIF